MIAKRPPKSDNYEPRKLGSRTQGPQGVKKGGTSLAAFSRQIFSEFPFYLWNRIFYKHLRTWFAACLEKKCPFFTIWKFQQKKTKTHWMFIFCVRRSMFYINLPCEFGGRRYSGLGWGHILIKNRFSLMVSLIMVIMNCHLGTNELQIMFLQPENFIQFEQAVMS